MAMSRLLNSVAGRGGPGRRQGVTGLGQRSVQVRRTAFSDALRDATGVRFTELPPTRDRVWPALDAAGVAAAHQPGTSSPS